MNESKMIYHYTTIDSLESILKSRKLKLSSCRDMKNHSDEGDALREALMNGRNDDVFRRALENHLQLQSHDLNYEELVNKTVEMRENSYMACFSNNPNNEDLWEKYADNEKGVVIGFERQYITNLHEELENSGTETQNDVRPNETRYIQMLYDDKMLRSYIEGRAADICSLVFAIDSYKDRKHQKEQESRLCVYLPKTIDENETVGVYDHEGTKGQVVRRIIRCPDHLWLQLESNYTKPEIDNTFAIDRILCRSGDTKTKISELINQQNLSDRIQIIYSPKTLS